MTGTVGIKVIVVVTTTMIIRKTRDITKQDDKTSKDSTQKFCLLPAVSIP